MNDTRRNQFSTEGGPHGGDGVPGLGIDLENRPGRPMETRPAPAGRAHWSTPERQPPPRVPVLKRSELAELTPVFSTALPPRLLSGAVRRLAYRIPEHHATHWGLLLLGDRLDVLEHRPWLGWPLLAMGALVWGGALVRRSRSRRGWMRRRSGALRWLGLS